MSLSFNEIKNRALAFSNDWKDENSENAEAKTFWNDFFDVFGLNRRRVASFEKRVKTLNGRGYIDLLWKGVLLVEHKSKGEDLDRAYQQALDYFPGLKDHELPKYIMVSDFARFRLYDLEENQRHEFLLADLHQNVGLLGFIAGYQKKKIEPQNPVNIKAAEKMGKLHDLMKDVDYEGHWLEVYLVRLLFCLYAEDTGIFQRQQFAEYIEQKTNEDGSDLAAHFFSLFQTLNTPEQERLRNLDDHLMAFPYINGKLFDEPLPLASFDSRMRNSILDCCSLDWGQISPAIFGSLFQSIMDKEARRNLGAHYTSEENILKLINPLFMDELNEKFKKVKRSRNINLKQENLKNLHNKMSNLRFLDPACGCGNFLIIAYRELRLLELKILREISKLNQKSGEQFLDVDQLIQVDVDQFYGIEIEEFPAQIAQVAMWLMDHQMNLLISQEFGQYFARIPLEKEATIVHGNALKLHWEEIIPKANLNYILGNPPFIGYHLQNKTQKEELKGAFCGVKGAGVLDYVTVWYLKATQYIQKTQIKVAFVSTNSISQGEQVGILWRHLFEKYGVEIFFAHQTFRWDNEARGMAAVHVVIVGFALSNTIQGMQKIQKRLFEYEDIKGEPHETLANNINPYLVNGETIVVDNRNIPLCNAPSMKYGNKPTDGGNLILTEEEKKDFLNKEPASKKYIRPFIGAHEFINGDTRHCLWLKDIDPSELKKMPKVIERVNKVRDFRKNSKKEPTQKAAEYPTLFAEIRQPKSKYIVIPRHSSENRQYIPFGYLEANVIVGDSCSSIENATLYHFGIITSKIHMAWVRKVCGRLESRYRYSNKIVYNNFPWPQNPREAKIKKIEKLAQAVLDARKNHPRSSLADLYDPLTMPPNLLKAHQALDEAVDSAYRKTSFQGESERLAFLFELYQEYLQGLK